ncbi:MAG: hypothetical protein JSW34_09785 [Candidatus Zixiibacteriota bacterium]|nr:MAG: hypothetical protein JSW34_09785 [candidate division Zixibacteria bacterium]
MTIRPQNLETISPVLASFQVSQTAGVDDLKDADIGAPVKLSDNGEVGPLGADEQLLGKLISLTLTDGDDGQRVATVQIGGICRLPVSAPVPLVGNRIVGGGSGTVKQAPAVASDPDGGNIARGTVLDVNGTIDCVILLN